MVSQQQNSLRRYSNDAVGMSMLRRVNVVRLSTGAWVNFYVTCLSYL